MIIDCRINEWDERALTHRVVDAVTGEDLTPLYLFYVDDEAGVIRRYLTRDGQFYDDPETGDVAWVEEHRAIRIVPRTEGAEARREETWRDRPSLL